MGWGKENWDYPNSDVPIVERVNNVEHWIMPIPIKLKKITQPNLVERMYNTLYKALIKMFWKNLKGPHFEDILILNFFYHLKSLKVNKEKIEGIKLFAKKTLDIKLKYHRYILEDLKAVIDEIQWP